MKNSKKTSRRGFSLLELIVSTAMLAALTTSCMVIVQTSYTAWRRHEDDHSQRQSGLAVLQHVARKVRQAKAVMAISAANDYSGSLSLLAEDGSIQVWEHNDATNEVLYGIGTATVVLASGIDNLKFVGVKLDGNTTTVEPGLIHVVECTAEVSLARPAGTPGGDEAVVTSIRAWIRAW